MPRGGIIRHRISTFTQTLFAHVSDPGTVIAMVLVGLIAALFANVLFLTYYWTNLPEPVSILGWAVTTAIGFAFGAGMMLLQAIPAISSAAEEMPVLPHENEETTVLLHLIRWTAHIGSGLLLLVEARELNTLLVQKADQIPDKSQLLQEMLARVRSTDYYKPPRHNRTVTWSEICKKGDELREKVNDLVGKDGYDEDAPIEYDRIRTWISQITGEPYG